MIPQPSPQGAAVVSDPAPSARPPISALEERYVARLDDEQQRYRVWDLQLGVWAQRPSFESERVARSVADALNGRGPAAPKQAKRGATKEHSDRDR